MRIAALVLCTLLTTTSSLAAQQRTERKWPLSADGAVKIYNFVGRVRVVGWDRDTVAVAASLPASYRLFGGGDRNAVKLGVESDDRDKQSAVVLEVRVPAGANVWIRGAATDIDVSGLIGTVDIGTVGGRVLVTGSPRMLTAESMTGALQVRGSPETLRAKTAGGDLSWEGSARDALLVSVSGTLRVNSGPIERLRVESVTGAVRVNATLRADANVSIETHSGDVELRLPARAPLRLDADAAMVTAPGVTPRLRPDGRFAGPITFDFNITKPPSAAPTVVVRSFTGRLVLAFGR
jgi:hypothetical protein